MSDRLPLQGPTPEMKCTECDGRGHTWEFSRDGYVTCDGCGGSGISGDFCWSCYKLEPIPKGMTPYQICAECGHVYLTAEDLVAAYKRESERYGAVPGDVDPDNIFSCQECVHDF